MNFQMIFAALFSAQVWQSARQLTGQRRQCVYAQMRACSALQVCSGFSGGQEAHNTPSRGTARGVAAVCARYMRVETLLTNTRRGDCARRRSAAIDRSPPANLEDC